MCLSLHCDTCSPSHRATVVFWSLSFLGLVVAFGSVACLVLFCLLRGHFIVRVVVHGSFLAGEGSALREVIVSELLVFPVDLLVVSFFLVGHARCVEGLCLWCKGPAYFIVACPCDLCVCCG